MTRLAHWARSLAAAPRRWFGPRPQLGVDFGGGTLRLVEIRRRGAVLEVAAAAGDGALGLRADGSIEDVGGAAAEIRALRRAESLRSSVATAAVPFDACRVRRLSLEATSRRVLERQVLHEVEQLGLDDDRDWSIDWAPLGRVAASGKQDILLVAVPTDVVASYVACLREADLLPVAIDVDVVALERLAPRSAVDDGRVIALLEVGSTRAIATIVRDGAAVFHGSVPVEPSPAVLAVSQHGESTPSAKELADAVHHLIGFFWTGAGEDAVDALWLCGSRASVPAISEQLEARLRLPVRTLRPMEVLASGGRLDAAVDAIDRPELALATALALRGIDR